MRARVASMLVLGLGFAPALAAAAGNAGQGGEMIIWSGAATRELAEAQRAGLQAFLAPLSTYLKASPAVVEAAQVRGLKPGLWIVALGVCAKDSASRLRDGPRTLVSIPLTYSWEESGDFASRYEGVHVAHFLVGHDRKLLDAEVDAAAEDTATLEGLRAVGKTVVTSVRYAEPRCPFTPGAEYATWKRETVAKIVGDELRLARRAPVRLQRRRCGE